MPKGIRPGSEWRNELLRELIGKPALQRAIVETIEQMATMQDAEKEAFAKALVKKIRAGEISVKETPDEQEPV